jgi:hypothetical protein
MTGSELFRMHELQACEIPLLWRSGSTVWSTSATVRAMPAHMDDPPEEARSADSSDADVPPAPSILGGLHALPALFQSPWRVVAGVSVPLPPRVAPICRPTQSAEDSSWTPRAAGRWSLVRVRRNTVGPLFDGTQALPCQLRHFPRSPAAPREVGCFALAAGPGGDSIRRYLPHSGCSRRQSPRDAAARLRAKVGAATVSFPFATETAGAATRRTLRATRRSSARRDPSVRPQSPATARRKLSNPQPRAPWAFIAGRLRYSTDPNNGSRVFEKSAVLPLLPYASVPRSAMDHQLCRIHGSPYPRTVPQQSRRLEPGLRAALGDWAHSHAPDRELQRSFAQQKILTHPPETLIAW